jgi:DNA-binding MarR family transcriptional regulator
MSKDNKTISWQLLQLMFQNKHRIYDIAEKYELTTMQSAALTMLKPDEPQAMRALSDYFMCDASTVTGLVDRMEARKLITRSNHPTDRRVKLLALTDEGLKIKESIMNETLRNEDERLKKILTNDERKVLQDLLTRLLNEEPTA